MPVTVRDNGYNAMMRQVAEMAKGHVLEVGNVEAGQTGGVANSTIGMWLEFGTSRMGHDGWSWLRGWYDANQSTIKADIFNVSKRVLEGKLPSQRVGLELLGLKYQKAIIARIRGGLSPANAPATIARKGSATPLIDTGAWLGSITYLVRRTAGA